MANPRGAVNFNEIGYNAATFLRQASGTGAIDFLPSVSAPYGTVRSTQQDMAASIITDSTARRGQDGDTLLGKIVVVNSDVVVIQFTGFMSLPYAVAPTVGSGVVCDSAGGVKTVVGGSEYKGAHTICVGLDTTNSRAWILVR